MKLTKAEKKTLKFVRNRFPVAWDESDSQLIIAVGERPIPTAEDVVNGLASKAPRAMIEEALAKLVALKLLKVVYLYRRDQFSEFHPDAGAPKRMPKAVPRTESKRYQITATGLEEIKGFHWNRIKALGPQVVWPEFVKSAVKYILFGAPIGWVLKVGCDHLEVTPKPPPRATQTTAPKPTPRAMPEPQPKQ